jgi:hypothetical protein
MTETLHGLNLGERTQGAVVPQPEVPPGEQPPADEAAPPANQAEEQANWSHQVWTETTETPGQQVQRTRAIGPVHPAIGQEHAGDRPSVYGR